MSSEKRPPPQQHAMFKALDFEGFRRLATDPSLTPYEKIGFPDSYRQGREAAIHADIEAKLPALQRATARILDIGAGCSDLPRTILRRSEELEQRLTFMDSAEMLALLPDSRVLEKVAGRFPECRDFVEANQGAYDAIIVYSVFHYVFAEGNAWSFLDRALSLLAPGGRLLLGDIPNLSMRRRFFASAAGEAHHREYTGRDERPHVEHGVLVPGEIDDSVVLSILLRARLQGFDAFLVPQAPGLPMANRREDLLFARP